MRQPTDFARPRSAGGVRAKTVVHVAFDLAAHRLLHHRVDSMDHLGRVAPRVVATEQVAAQPCLHKNLGGFEHLGLGSAKTVDALFRVANDEDAGSQRAFAARRTATRARVTRQPGEQRLPLQRTGVLKLVDQHLFDLRIQALLQPARQHRV